MFALIVESAPASRTLHAFTLPSKRTAAVLTVKSWLAQVTVLPKRTRSPEVPVKVESKAKVTASS